MSFSKVFQSYQPSQQWESQFKSEPLEEEEDSASVLDGRILDTDTSEMSVSHNHGTNPIDASQPMNHSNNTMWQQEPTQNQLHPVLQQQLQSPLTASCHDPFPSSDLDQQQQPYFVGANASWPSMTGSGACTPTPTYTSPPQEFDNVFSQDQQNESVLNQRRFHTAQGFTLPASIPMSPQSSQGWMSAASSDMAEAHSRAVRSPTLPPGSPRLSQRPDGIRKKNARFEIPKERNLNTIDGLIKYYTEQGDETQLKELKQQKRLLRNRQAAYVIPLHQLSSLGFP